MQHEEARRPKQGATEERITSGAGGVKAACPLLDIFKDDTLLATLTVDVEQYRTLVRDGCYSHPACFCPLCWPQAVFCCIPCIRFGLMNKCEQAADAHSLTLHSNSLLWKVSPYPLEMRQLSASFTDFRLHPSCHQLFSKEQLTLEIEEVFPLREVHSVKILDCLQSECGRPVASSTLVVTLVGLDGVVCAVDAPENGQEFARACMKRIEEVKSEGPGVRLPEQWAMYKNVTLKE